jgi:hypothetical protein
VKARAVKLGITTLIAAAVLISVAIVCVLALWFVTRGGSIAPTAVITTSDGQRWTLATQLNPNGTRIAVITDANSQIVFTGSMRFSDYSRWFVYGSAGEFWVYSGDIGILYYSRDTGGLWVEQSWIASLATSKMPREFYSKLPDTSRKRIDPAFVLP